jgi:hypothetical protein
MRTILLVMALALFMLVPSPSARADVIVCPYPGIGTRVHVDVIASGEGFYCDDPIEINGSHMHCQSGSGGVGLNLGFTAPLGGGDTGAGGFGNFQFGGSKWDCGWVCPPIPGDPDILISTIGPPAAQPNPPGAWKDKIQPTKCSTYVRGGPVDDNSLPPGGLNPFYEQPATVNPQTVPPNNGPETGEVISPVRPDPVSLGPTGN